MAHAVGLVGAGFVLTLLVDAGLHSYRFARGLRVDRPAVRLQQSRPAPGRRHDALRFTREARRS